MVILPIPVVIQGPDEYLFCRLAIRWIKHGTAFAFCSEAV